MVAEGNEENNQSWEEELKTVVAWCELPMKYKLSEDKKMQMLDKYPTLKKRFTEVI